MTVENHRLVSHLVTSAVVVLIQKTVPHVRISHIQLSVQTVGKLVTCHFVQMV